MLNNDPQAWRPRLQEIEAAAGISIPVVQDPHMQTKALTNFYFPIIPGRLQATIWHRDPEPDLTAMMHEIEHCRRYLIEGVPMLTVRGDCSIQRCNPETGEPLPETPCPAFSAVWVDNELEHLTINPRLSELGLDWQTDTQEALRSRWETDYAPSAARFRLLDWVSTKLLLPQRCRVLRTARDVLRGAGLWDEAENLVDQVRITLPSKEATLLVILSALRFFPLEAAMLLDVPRGRMRPLHREVTFYPDPADTSNVVNIRG